VFLIAVGLAGLLFGVGSSEVRRFERAAANDVSSRLTGEHRRVMVRTKLDPFQAMGGRLKSATITASEFAVDGLPLFTEPDGSKRGRLDELKLRLTNFELTGLHVKRLEARIPGSRFDWGLAQRHGKIRLTQCGVGTGSVEVEREALRNYISAKHPNLTIERFELSTDLVEISGKGRFLGFESAVNIRSKLASPDGSSIHLTDADIDVNGQKANPAARDAILKLLNPVLDLDRDLKLYAALKIEELVVSPESIIARGVATIPVRPIPAHSSTERSMSAR
jgi:hypothetical protein